MSVVSLKTGYLMNFGTEGEAVLRLPRQRFGAIK
jgi:hypothetical protein